MLDAFFWWSGVVAWLAVVVCVSSELATHKPWRNRSKPMKAAPMVRIDAAPTEDEFQPMAYK